MKYAKTVEANIWDSSNEIQSDKIVEWLTLLRSGMFDYDSVENELTVQTVDGPVKVHDSQAIILDHEKNTIELMSGRAFATIYELMEEI